VFCGKLEADAFHERARRVEDLVGMAQGILTIMGIAKDVLATQDQDQKDWKFD
jgi:hypothetical protein